MRDLHFRSFNLTNASALMRKISPAQYQLSKQEGLKSKFPKNLCSSAVGMFGSFGYGREDRGFLPVTLHIVYVLMHYEQRKMKV